MRELRERLERAVVRLEELHDAPSCRRDEKNRLSGKIEGVKLALSYVYEDDLDVPIEILVPRLVSNPNFARGLVTPDVTSNGLVVVNFAECRLASDSFLVALLEEIKESGAAGICVRYASPEMSERIAALASGIKLVEAG